MEDDRWRRALHALAATDDLFMLVSDLLRWKAEEEKATRTPVHALVHTLLEEWRSDLVHRLLAKIL